jgi:hypothetical protein
MDVDVSRATEGIANATVVSQASPLVGQTSGWQSRGWPSPGVLTREGCS